MAEAPTQGSAPAPGFLSIGDAHQELMSRGAEEANPEADDSEPEADEPDQQESDELELSDEDVEIPLDDDDDLDDEPEHQPRMHTVKIDGEEKSVTEDELRNGYQRDADYRKKTQEVSERQKQLDAELEQAKVARARYTDQVEAAIRHNQAFVEAEKDVDWDALYEENPFEYMKRKEEMRDAKEQLDRNQVELQQARQQEHQENEVKFEEYKLEQKAIILGSEGKEPLIADWKDPKTAQEESKGMEQYLVNAGLNKDEIEQIWDARLVSIVRDAYMYSKGKKVAGKKVQKAPKMSRADKARPAAPTTTRRIKSLEKQLDNTRDPRVAANLLMARGAKSKRG